ncbi:carbohydrate ABC transporter permease [Halalkalibacterium halodurans]|uniref:Glycerol-3-phosphate ABC transporter permease n=1 Tax=Halalkalibacterium halodurans TaxID=86665 RepID=A0A0M0KLT7_ALKHA|nr:carbohydrate ABC transporter permease [Halalkalibacterium halodurans]MDY7221611.1 carbohydrate ABC transporter permease [Halalkalibacterium halodurans]MDY7240887.1 carbohydrate ABC transporter permease [Halalkalibacterium halodurans]MED4164774.1 carbohydrate ABC transporter permease [Halalkalibacterium halodurans]TES57908.1 carbohydrate ABC transporter permease [Halalkalibacterium halodurans]TPE70734.1 carbohydrate ABC transporter permease [Halalkalibacterium halodurans]
MKTTRPYIVYPLLCLSALLIFFPIVYAFFVSFMSGAEVLSRAFFPSSVNFDNYEKVFSTVPLLHYLQNSFIVSITVMIGQLIVCSLSAYVFAFIPFKGRTFVFLLFISTLMIPWEAAMIPNFLTIQKLGWLNSYLGMTVPFFALAFGTFLLRQHFKTIPKELHEAAQVEGLSPFQFFYKVCLPYAKTSLVTLGIYGFLTTWNMYLWPLLVTTNDRKRTVQIGLKQLQTVEVATEWGVVMAGVVVVIIPTLLLLFLGQKQLQKGLTQGAIK